MYLNQIFICIIGALLSTQLVSAQEPYTDGTDCLNVPKYTGGWWEIYSSRWVWINLEYGCKCSNAYYNLANVTDPNSTSLSVLNMCQRYDTWENVTGIATQLNPTVYPGQFNVQLHSDKFSIQNEDADIANYIILRIWRSSAGDYEHALVGGSENNRWWFLSRYPTVESSVWQSARKTLRAYDYDVGNPHKMEQEVC